MPHTVHRSRPAMGTLFEAVLCGDDVEHLAAVADAVLDEVVRVERLLSRFDPRSEISRLNRAAGGEPILVDYELLAVLQQCRRYWQESDGYFDPTAGSPSNDATLAEMELDDATRHVRLARPGTQLDLGGFGKGYALDCAAQLLREQGITSALLHGGTSSILALGTNAPTKPWTIGLRDPQSEDGSAELAQLPLRDAALSTSGVLSAGGGASDIIDPHRQATLSQQAGCAVVARTGAAAEAWSTALLAMGRTRAAAYTENQPDADLQGVAWITCLPAEPSQLEWLQPLGGMS